MKAWQLCLRDVLPEVPGCAEPMAEHALLRAAQEFMQKTRAWKVWLDPVITDGLNLTYDLNLELRSELVRIEAATLGGQVITIAREQDVPANWQDGSACVPTCIFTTDSKTINLLPLKTAGMSLAIQATLKPSNTATGLDDAIFDRYVEVIATGAKARLMSQPDKAYSSPGAAAMHRSNFLSAIDTLKTNIWRGTAATRPRARSHWF